VIDPFAHLRLDLERVMAAGTMVEAVDAVAQEAQGSHRLFLLLNRGLKALDQGGRGRDLVSAFLLKLAGVVGVEPALTRCASCGNPDSLERFSFSAGGALCPNCRTENAVKLRPGLTPYLAALAAADLSFLPTTDPTLSGEAMGVARRFVEFHLDRRLVSLAVLDG
jgi:DNA repair protein RecO (recombination protein O)